ncbi:hypothetical protein EV421DRAFT_1370477 [Armillaria borealis]|uniref:Uncharacterized protein n=1 Tax=Armillaria borealis TaxID=47425 RepID=A0AA39J0J0_9AGAR|nr:hypothetical protein EV421DRAFT_1370477 [Armillaria borealis]
MYTSSIYWRTGCTYASGNVDSRFPTLQIFAGHLGERLPSDLFRTDEHLLRQVPLGIPMQQNASWYWLMNLYGSTTARNFATPLLRFHNSYIGLDRTSHSIDYPFALISEGQQWVDSLADVLTREELLELKKEGGSFLRFVHEFLRREGRWRCGSSDGHYTSI